MTVGLFLVLELISNNVLEPWPYGVSTGISDFALMVAAVFSTGNVVQDDQPFVAVLDE